MEGLRDRIASYLAEGSRHEEDTDRRLLFEELRQSPGYRFERIPNKAQNKTTVELWAGDPQTETLFHLWFEVDGIDLGGEIAEDDVVLIIHPRWGTLVEVVAGFDDEPKWSMTARSAAKLYKLASDAEANADADADADAEAEEGK